MQIRLFNLFRTNKIISILILFLFFIPFLFYVIKFGNYGLSNSQEIWGQFGDYIGGILNPTLTFLTVVFVLYTIHSQIENNKESEYLSRLKVAESKINSIYESLYPSRVYFGEADTADSQNISFRKILNTTYNDTFVGNDELNKRQGIKYDKIYYSEDVFVNDLEDLTRIFRAFEQQLLEHKNIFNNDKLLNFYKEIYFGEVQKINTVINRYFNRHDFTIKGILWFETTEEIQSIYPGLFT